MDVDDKVPPLTEDELRALRQDAQHGVAGAREALQRGGAALAKWRKTQENHPAK
jgi:hypothetical protein